MSTDFSGVLGSSDLFSVKGKTALITGASSGIGAIVAVFLAKEGANVVVAARREDKLKAVVDHIQSLGKGKAAAVALDVSTDAAAVDEAVEQAWTAFDRIDILVNNAGVFEGGPLLDVKEEAIDKIFDINLKGAFLVAQSVAKRQVADGKGGSIINISSVAGNPFGAFNNGGIYSSSKAALTKMTQNMAFEWGPHKIRVNSISPGWFGSEMTADYLTILNDFLTKLPVPRIGDTSNELSGTVLLLSSPAGAYITGADFRVDGGMSLMIEQAI